MSTKRYIVNVEAAIYRGDQWLIVKRSQQEEHAPGTLALVGGKVEIESAKDDVLEETLRREVMEEVGVEVDVVDYLESKAFAADDGRIVVDIVFLCRYKGGETRCVDKHEVAEVHWATARDTAGNLKAPGYLKQAIARAEEKRLARMGDAIQSCPKETGLSSSSFTSGNIVIKETSIDDLSNVMKLWNDGEVMKFAGNIFDNDAFFEKYSKLRKREHNYNGLVEQPAIKALLPGLQGKTVLDLGCGYGSNCIDFANRGAAGVVGIDISNKMLGVAREENSHELIEYKQMDMSKIGCLTQKFDLVFSSLAFHYVNDFGKLLRDIRCLLNENGILLFSQEHPYTTAPKCGPSWTKDAQGRKIHYNLSDYMCSGIRHAKFFADSDDVVEKYHRPFSEIVNSIISHGFFINNVVEPVPGEYALEKRPDYYDEFHKTTSIIIKATKA